MCTEKRTDVRRKEAKEEWTEELCKNLENGMVSGKSKEAYNTLKALTRPISISQQSSRTAAETS